MGTRAHHGWLLAIALTLSLAFPALLTPVASAQEAGAPPGTSGVPAYVVTAATEPGLGTITARAASAARVALRSIDGVAWQAPDQLFMGYDAESISLLSRAHRQMAMGREAFVAFELEQAITALTGAVEDFDAAASLIDDPRPVAEALFYLGASYVFDGQRRPAAQVFSRLHRQMPGFTPDPNVFNPDVVQAFERAQPRDARRPRARIGVDSNPPGATVHIDFLARGVTPFTEEGLAGGEHVVRVTRPGSSPQVDRVRVRRNAADVSAYLTESGQLTEAQAMDLNEALALIPESDITAAGEGSPVGRIADILSLSKIAILRVSRGDNGRVNLELLLFDAATGARLAQRTASASIEQGLFEGQIVQLVAGISQMIVARDQAQDVERIPATGPLAAATGTENTASGDSIFEQWWFWTIVGAVAVGGGAAVGIGLALDDGGGGGQGAQVIFRF